MSRSVLVRKILSLRRRRGLGGRSLFLALAPVVPDPDPADEPASPPHADEAHATEDGFTDQVASAAPGFEDVGEETAELDMQAVLDAEDGRPQGTASAQEPAGGEGQLARPVPGAEDRAAPPPEIPGQEKLTFE